MLRRPGRLLAGAALGVVVLAALLLVLASVSSAAAPQPDPAPTPQPVTPDPAPDAAPTAPARPAPVQPVAPTSGERPARFRMTRRCARPARPNARAERSRPVPDARDARARPRQGAAAADADAAGCAGPRAATGRAAPSPSAHRWPPPRGERLRPPRSCGGRRRPGSSAHLGPLLPSTKSADETHSGILLVGSGSPAGARARERLAALAGDTGDEGAVAVRRVGRRLVVLWRSWVSAAAGLRLRRKPRAVTASCDTPRRQRDTCDRWYTTPWVSLVVAVASPRRRWSSAVAATGSSPTETPLEKRSCTVSGRVRRSPGTSGSASTARHPSSSPLLRTGQRTTTGGSAGRSAWRSRLSTRHPAWPPAARRAMAVRMGWEWRSAEAAPTWRATPRPAPSRSTTTPPRPRARRSRRLPGNKRVAVAWTPSPGAEAGSCGSASGARRSCSTAVRTPASRTASSATDGVIAIASR